MVWFMGSSPHIYRYQYVDSIAHGFMGVNVWGRREKVLNGRGCKIFKQCFDKNFIVYLSEYRVARAKELLGDVLINVKDVSQKVGYRDSNYFAKVFKRIAGVTPTEYRTQVLKEAGER